MIACATFAVAMMSNALASAGDGQDLLPPQTLHGPAARLHQYPTVSLATRRQEAAAVSLLGAMRRAAQKWRTPRAATAAGFVVRTAPRTAGDIAPHFLHAENRAFRKDGVYLDPRAPETLVYANAPGSPLELIGVMFSMPRGMHGPTPGGPVTRWHTHRVCIEGVKRGRKPLPDGTCPPGAKARQGSEMLHVWFTRDLRSAFAIHAPEPELCRVSKLPARWCADTHGAHAHGA